MINNTGDASAIQGKSICDIIRCMRLSNHIYSEFVKVYLDIIKRNTTNYERRILSIEVPCGSKSSRAASCLGMARGVLGAVMSHVSRSNDETDKIFLIKPTDVHKRVTGETLATKEQIISYVCDRYNDQIEVVRFKRKQRYILRSKDGLEQTYNKNEFEHIADSIVIGEIGIERSL